MSDPTLTRSEREQLRQLLSVYDNPSITAMWRKAECDRLVELGYAQRHEYPDRIMVVSLRPDRVEAARSVLAGVVSTREKDDERPT